jgi:predicted  nucleic acid-binding Zn-ribbon protein
MLKYGDLDTLINDRVKDQEKKFSDYRVITFNQFEKEVDKIKKQEEEEERLKADAEAEERAKIDAELNKKIEMEKRRGDFEAKVHDLKNKKPELEEPKKKVIRKPKNLEGYFKLLDSGIEKEVFYLYDTFKNVQNEKESIVTKYKNIGKYPSPEMADEIKSLGIGSLRNKIKDIVSSNINYKLRDSFIDMFNTTHSIPTINEEFYYINTEIGVIKLTENQFKTISYLL